MVLCVLTVSFVRGWGEGYGEKDHQGGWDTKQRFS